MAAASPRSRDFYFSICDEEDCDRGTRGGGVKDDNSLMKNSQRGFYRDR